MFIELYRKINKLPKNARIEACSLCNLDCRDCYMRKTLSGQIINNGYLKFLDFKNFIRKNPYIKNIELSLAGEIFLNPDLKKIIRLASFKKINLTAFNGVNFNSVSDEMLELLVKYKFKGITFSIDGATNETYKVYRKNGNFDKVIENIQKLNDFKKIYKTKFPILQWQYILFKHNIKDAQSAIHIARDLNMASIYFKEPWNKEVTKFDSDLLQKFIPFKPFFDKEFQKILKDNQYDLCFQPWLSPQINWDGRLLGCCCSTNHDLGINVFDMGLKKALKSPSMEKMRALLTGKIIKNSDIACKYCFKYQNMQKKGKYLNEKEIFKKLLSNDISKMDV